MEYSLQRNRQRIDLQFLFIPIDPTKKEIDWLKEVDSISLQSALKNLDDSFKRFFKKQNKSPRFKSKKNPAQSYTTKQTNGNIAIAGNQVKLPKLGLVKFAKSQEINGRIISATISRKTSGKYFVSLLAEVEIQEYPETGSTIGIDVGLKDFAILSDGTFYKNSLLVKIKKHKEAEIASSFEYLLKSTNDSLVDQTIILLWVQVIW